MPESRALLASALCELAALGTDHDREQLAALQDRLAAERLRVVVAGEANRGKSTLINALLGRAMLPAGVTPVTTVVTIVRYGDDPHAEVLFLDGHEEQHPLAALAGLVTEHGNPGNHRCIATVTVYADAPVLAGGAELVDTPGTGSVLGWEATEAAQQVLESMDAAVFVLAADPPVSASEANLLSRLAELSMTTFVVLNKADHLDAPRLAEAAEFTRRVLRQNFTRLYPMSAGIALQGDDPGLDAFAADFTAYLAARRKADLTQSAATKARQMATARLDEVRQGRRAACSHAADVADRVGQFTVRLAEASVHSRDPVAVVNGESARLLFALNDAVDIDGPGLARSIGRRLDAMLDGQLRAASPAEIERAGRDGAVALTSAVVGSWCGQWQGDIEQGLADLDTRVAADLAAGLRMLRDSAADLLDLDLAEPGPGNPFTKAGQLFRTSAQDAGQVELPAGAMHRGMPGELSRRRARQRVRAEAAVLASSELQRASAGLRSRLAEATRTLAQMVEQRCTDSAEWMRAAQRAAAHLRESSAAEARRAEQELADRETTLRHVLGLLDRAARREEK